MWLQNYTPCSSLTLSALVAALPLFLLFYLLALRRTPGHHAAAACLLCATSLALLVWEMPAATALGAATYGMAFGLASIAWVVITAVWLYNMTVESGEFTKIRHSLAALTNDRRIQALFIAYAFSAFIEGAAGFGSPVAICAAMLAGLGFHPFKAAGICMLCNSAPAAFGAIGIPVIVSGDVAGLNVQNISRIVGQHLAVLSALLPFWLSFVLCGWKKTLEIWPALVVAGVSFAASMYAVAALHGPALADIVAGLTSLFCLLTLLRFWKPKSTWRFPEEDAAPAAPANSPPHFTPASIARAWLPYMILTAAVFICGGAYYKELVGALTWSVPWPLLENAVSKAAPIVAKTEPYPALFTLNILSVGGTAIFFSGILSSLVMPGYGFGKGLRCFARTLRQLRFSVLSILLVLGLAYLMNYAGMSSTLGLAFTRTGTLFPFFAPVIGWLGVFLTGSDTSANALFSSLQRTTADALGFDPNLTVAANSSGGVTGKMISPQSISVATAATGQTGKEGDLFRFTLRHSLVMLLIVCLLCLLQAG